MDEFIEIPPYGRVTRSAVKKSEIKEIVIGPKSHADERVLMQIIFKGSGKEVANYITIYMKDMDEAISFYKKVVGDIEEYPRKEPVKPIVDMKKHKSWWRL